jgi:hypothetical protein
VLWLTNIRDPIATHSCKSAGASSSETRHAHEFQQHGNRRARLRELTADETTRSLRLLPLAIMAFAIGFDAGFIGVMSQDLD